MAHFDKEEDTLIEECEVCGGDIYIDADCEEEDIVYCNDCEAEYLVRSLDPLKLSLLDDNQDAEDEDGSSDDEYE